MDNVPRETIQEKKLEAVQMKKNEKMAVAINDFILNNDFLTRFIVDNVKDKIYTERSYNINMVEQVLINDIDNGYNGSYIIDFIIDEIDVYTLIDKIDEMYIDDFMELAQQTQQRNY